jgi:hypothetical protein
VRTGHIGHVIYQGSSAGQFHNKNGRFVIVRGRSYSLFKSSYEVYSRELEDEIVKIDIEKG